MKKHVLFVFAFLQFICFCSVGQSVYRMDERNVISTTSGVFYDDGGQDGNVGNKQLSTTFTAPSGFVEIFFTEFNIPFDAQLIVYNGTPSDNKPFGIFSSGDKPWSFRATVITVVYNPSPSNSVARGWRGVIQNASTERMPDQTLTMPESDCPYAIPICSNSTINTSANQYPNTGVVNDDNGSCYSGTGNGGSVWYSFSPQTNGLLDFSIAPSGSTDYDYVLWDITNGCSNKVELSCNFSGTYGTTGMNSSGTTSSEPASGVVWNQKINVVTTKKYAICINYYSGNNDGFTLTFKNEAGDVSITDNTPPTILNSYANNCTSATQLHITFSEWVQCSTVNPVNITIPGHTVTIVNDHCSGGKTNQVDISVFPALTTGTYTITGLNVLDMCGNPMNSPYNIVLGVPPIATVTPGVHVCRTTNYLFGIPIGYSYTPSSQTLTATNTAGGATTFLWSDGYVGASNTVSPAVTTTYTVTVTNGGCSTQLTTTIIVEPSPTPNIGPDITMCTGLPLTLNAAGGGTYQWQVQTGANFFGQPTFSNIGGATGSSYSTTPVQYGTSGATYYQVIVTSPSGCQGTDQIKITFGSGVFSISATNPYLCLGQSTTLTVPAGITAYTWSTGTNANSPLSVSPTVTTTYTVTSTTGTCPGTATITVPVRPLPVAAAVANPTIACVGTPVNLSGSPSNSVTNVTENFEGGTQTFTLVNGAYNNWYQGTAAFCNGAKGLYIGTAAANNTYFITTGFLGLTSAAATNHAYKDISVTNYCTANLSFNWRCGGNANAALSVWFVPTTFVPVAGTAITASATNILAGGPYFGSGAACNAVLINMLPYIGQNIRVVFSWNNTGGLLAPAVVPPAAMIDDFLFTQNNSYTYSWTSVPAGFTSTFQDAIANPSVATTYNLLVTRCDGCAATTSVPVGPCSALGIDLVRFTGKCNGSDLHFEWTTSSETNNHYFTLEGSKDGIDFREFGRVNGAGNSSSMLNYKSEVTGAEAGYRYFRLRQNDFNGSFTYSGIIDVDCIENAAGSIVLYPNPFTNELTITSKTKGEFVLYDVTGKEILRKNITDSETRINTSDIAGGFYFIQCNGENFKLIKN